MRRASHLLEVLDADGDGRGLAELEPEVAEAHRERWRALNAIPLATLWPAAPSK